MPEEPKKKKYRLRKPASQIQQALDDLVALMENKAMKPAKLADIAIARLSALQSLLLIKSEEGKARLKHSDVDALMKENAELRAQLGKTTAEPTPKESDVVAKFKAKLEEIQ